MNKTLDGNEAVASVAYKLSEAHIVYPITPSSTMGEFADEWAAKGKKNIWGMVPNITEMQSEAGAIAAVHGAIQNGTLATTYTASQGLLLMIPNMYKIAGELTPLVIHVAARSLACQGLSIFGDHSDVMAVRATGFALLCSGSVQQAHDMACIAHAATLESRIPFVHFFDGFRTSSEVNKIEVLNDEQLAAMINYEFIAAHRQRALSSEHPVIRGTAQNPDVYFQGRETVNPFYKITPGIVGKYMQKFGELTGRKYQLIDYYGHPEATRVIVIMGSGGKVVRETIDWLANKEQQKLGVLEIHLYRPFPVEHFLAALPKSTAAIAVLDRTKEPGAVGEPLYQDVATALSEALNLKTLPTKEYPKLIGGRYGLSSKEFTPTMVKAVFDELLKDQPKNHFTIGINDDVSGSSLPYDANLITESDQVIKALFYGLGADGTVGANKNSIKIIGEGTDLYAQGYFVYDSKKSGSRTVSHLRFGPDPIDAPYLIQAANFIAIHQFNFIEKTNLLTSAKTGAVVLLNSPHSAETVWEYLPREVQQTIIERKLELYVINADKVAQAAGMGTRINTVMQACFFAIAGVLPKDEAITKIKEAIHKTYSKKGEEVVKKNYAAVDQSISNLHKVNIPPEVSKTAKAFPSLISNKAPEFVQKVLGPMMADCGNELPVSVMPIDGTYPTGTTRWEKRNVSFYIAAWDQNTCIQCGQCSLVCPHGVIKVKRCNKELLATAPTEFKSAIPKNKDAANERYILQVYLEDCTGCGLCNAACPAKNKENIGAKAINLALKAPILEQERKNIEFFETLPYVDRTTINTGLIPNVQYLQAMFEFSGACAGCGETPYVKLISQLFGDRMIVANATGCSSIYGGNLPTTPWTFDKNGRGPAWANSLFEDNAEFGLGFRLATDQNQQQALELMHDLSADIGVELVQEISAHIADNDDIGIQTQRLRITKLKDLLKAKHDAKAEQLLLLADYLVKRSIWLLGGDGWAYDIGFGGLDHVLGSGKNVNVLVLNTEVYSNTGGQASKATPLGAVAKFASGGKHTTAKNLGVMMMSYKHVYVAQIALGANPTQALKAIKEAENYPGPSLIIAYSHCIAHGINMRLGLQQQELAVNSGYWSLYRRNPELISQGKNPFVLDSKPPSIPLQEYIMHETRFKSLMQSNPKEAEKLIAIAQEEINQRFAQYKKMAEDDVN